MTTDTRPVVVSRKLREAVAIGDARVLVSEIRPGRVTLRILAPPGTAVHRLGPDGEPVGDTATATSSAVRLGPRMERERHVYAIATCPHPPEHVAVRLERARRVVRCGDCNVRLLHPDDLARAAEAVRAILTVLAQFGPAQAGALLVEPIERALTDLRLDLAPAPIVAAESAPASSLHTPPLDTDARVAAAEARAGDAEHLLETYLAGTEARARVRYGNDLGVERACVGCGGVTRYPHNPADCVAYLRGRLDTLDRARRDDALALVLAPSAPEEPSEC